MKNQNRYALAGTTLCFIHYIVFAFIFNELNPIQWHIIGKIIFAFMIISIFFKTLELITKDND